MANYKENPRTQTITFRVTAGEKKKLQRIANRRTNGKVSELIWQQCLKLLKEEEEDGTTEQEKVQLGG